ncbi:hypothetical protein AAF712_009315 [Marasmius tenuissimus]|uniref:Cupredoxin n=1 Tax=Marasmius tenuissimus TaxID=585030 RepID=A0ABR2ZQS8_9AGAR
MRFSTVAATLLPVAGALAATQTIAVGEGGLTFNPPSITAAMGDIIEFQFKSKNHSVSQSTFAEPCKFKENGVDSGFQATQEGAAQIASWSFELNTTEPLWFFCAQLTPADHCAMGMVFAVNPTAEKSFETFKAAAMGSASGNGTAPAGGETAPTGSASAAGGAATDAGGSGASGSPTDAAGQTSASASAGASASSAADGTAAANQSSAGFAVSRNTVGLLSMAGLVLGLTL